MIWRNEVKAPFLFNFENKCDKLLEKAENFQ